MVFNFLVFDPSVCERQYPNLPLEVEVTLPESHSLHTHIGVSVCFFGGKSGVLVCCLVVFSCVFLLISCRFEFHFYKTNII
ncbi:hypothetical protein Hanom_Chr07g00646011 [Helianthus anomalus]